MEMFAEEAERLSKILNARLNERKSSLTVKKTKELKKLMDEILADVRAGRRKLDDLCDETVHFEKLLELNDSERKGRIVRLSHYRETKFPLKWKAHDKKADRRKSPQTEADRVDFFSGDKERNWRRAVDLHQESGRYAFVSYSDVSADVWRKPNAVKDLGETTIFIPEFADLTLDQKKQLREAWNFLNQEREGPHFIVATSGSQVARDKRGTGSQVARDKRGTGGQVARDKRGTGAAGEILSP